jgi:four helix bundle protein
MGPQLNDLEARLMQYAERIYKLAETARFGHNLSVLTRQLLRSATSVGANYAESLDAVYEKEKLLRLILCRRELRESSYWLELISKVKPELKVHLLIDETKELRAIFSVLIY